MTYADGAGELTAKLLKLGHKFLKRLASNFEMLTNVRNFCSIRLQ